MAKKNQNFIITDNYIFKYQELPTLGGVCVLNHVQLFVTPWAVACQAPLSMGIPRQEHWTESPFPVPQDLPDPGEEPGLLHGEVDFLPLSHLGSLTLGGEGIKKKPTEVQSHCFILFHLFLR